MESKALFDIDVELDALLDEIQEQAACSAHIEDGLPKRFQGFCQAHGEKVDRIGRFVRMMEARESYCKAESLRLSERARIAAGRVERTKAMVMYHLLSRNIAKVEGKEFTLRLQKSSQDSVKLSSESLLPVGYRRFTLDLSGVLYETVLANLPEELANLVVSSVNGSRADNEAIRNAISRNETVPGAELRRGSHLRVA